jgi:hypothetical protein
VVHVITSFSKMCSRQTGVLVFFLAAITTTSSSDQSRIDASIVGEATRSVVPIVCLVRNQENGHVVRYRYVGTAFLVDTAGTFVTAAHVVSNFDRGQRTDCHAAIAFPSSDRNVFRNGQWSTLPAGEWELPPKTAKWFPFDPTNCYEDYGTDVAVCKTRQALTAEAVPHETTTVSTVRPVTGARVFFVGFGQQAMNATAIAATIAGFSETDRKRAIVIDKSAWPGASGSPIFASDGKQIVGMITETGIGDTSGRSFGVTGETILAVLAKVK